MHLRELINLVNSQSDKHNSFIDALLYNYMPIITFSIDDGYEEIYTIGLPLFQSKGITASISIIPDLIGQSFETYPLMNLNKINTLYNAGWEIASHSSSHAHLTTLDRNGKDYEIRLSKSKLENYGFKIDTFCLPFGQHDAEVDSIVQSNYYNYRYSDWGENNINSFNRHDLKSKWVVNTTTFNEIKSWIDSAVINDSWLIIMLHHINHPENEYSINSDLLSQVIDYAKSMELTFKNINEVSYTELPPYEPKPVLSLIFAGGTVVVPAIIAGAVL